MAVPVRLSPGLITPSIDPRAVGPVPSPLYRPSASELYVPGAGEAVKALGSPADAVMGVASAESKIENATAVKAMENDFLRQTQDLLHNSDNAYFKSKGIDAKTQFEPTVGKLSELATKMVGATSNDFQRRLLSEALEGHITTTRGQMSSYQDVQTKEWTINTQLGSAALHTQRANTMPFDDKHVEESADRVYSSTFAAYKLKGMPDEVATAQAVEAKSAVLSSIAMLRIHQDPATGLAYYDKIAPTLDPKDRERIDAAVTAARNIHAADTIIANIMPNQARYDTFQELKKAGFSDNAAAALTGGVQAESTFSPTAQRDNDAGPGLHSVGALQWNRERLAGLIQFAKANNADVRDLSTQRKYMIHELTDPNSPYKAIGDQLKRGDITIEEANQLVTNKFIIPKFSRETGPASDAEYAKRLAFSRAALSEGTQPPDRAQRDRTYERLQGVLADQSIPQPIRDEVNQKVTQMTRIENTRRETALRNVRDLEDASVMDAISGKINAPQLATRLTEAAAIALGAQDRSEHRRLSYLAANAPAITSFATLPLDRAKEALATFLQGTSKAMAGGILAGDKEVREQQRIEAGNKVQAFETGMQGGKLESGALSGLATEAFNSYIKTQDFAKALDIKTKYESWVKANAAVTGRHDAIETTMRNMEKALDENGASVADVFKHQYMEKIIAQQEAAYKHDPYSYAENKLVKAGLAPRVELNLATKDPTLLITQLKARSQVAAQAEREEGRPIPPLRTAEVEQVWNHLQSADQGNKQNVLALFGRSIEGKQLEYLAPQLASKGPAGVAYYAAMIGYAKNDPFHTDIANRIVRGADLLWKGGEAAKDLTTGDTLWRTELNTRMGGVIHGMGVDKVNMLFTAIKALYVEDQGSLGGKWGEPTDTDKLDKAIRDVVGDVDVINGQRIALPRGTSRGDVLGAVRFGLDEQTRNGLRSQDGTPISPDTLANQGVFYSVGDGKYAVKLPEGRGHSRILKEVMDPNGSGKPWILDIKDPMRRYKASEYQDATPSGAIP